MTALIHQTTPGIWTDHVHGRAMAVYVIVRSDRTVRED
jgi:hypothetical protein